MASVQPKKVAAILAAVVQHAAETQLPTHAPTWAPAELAALASHAPLPPAWARAGRQDAMYDRVVWQRRQSRTW